MAHSPKSLVQLYACLYTQVSYQCMLYGAIWKVWLCETIINHLMVKMTSWTSCSPPTDTGAYFHHQPLMASHHVTVCSFWSLSAPLSCSTFDLLPPPPLPLMRTFKPAAILLIWACQCLLQHWLAYIGVICTIQQSTLIASQLGNTQLNISTLSPFPQLLEGMSAHQSIIGEFLRFWSSDKGSWHWTMQIINMLAICLLQTISHC